MSARCLLDYIDPSSLEYNLAGIEGEKGVIAPHTDVFTRLKGRAALPDYYRAGLDLLAPKTLDAAILRITVAAVPRGTLSFFVCHFLSPKYLFK